MTARERLKTARSGTNLAEDTQASRDPRAVAVFDAMKDLLLVFDCEGRLLHTNPAASGTLGYSPEELAEMTVFDLHPPELRGQVASDVADVFAERTDSCQLPLRTKDGTWMIVETKVSRGRWDNHDVMFGVSRIIFPHVEQTVRPGGELRTCLFTKCPVRDSRGNVGGMPGISRDTSALKRVEETLRESEERVKSLQLQLAHLGHLSTMRELVAGIAHEVNQPLHSMVNYAKACQNLLKHDNPDLGDLSDWAGEIAAAAMRAGEIVKRLQDRLGRPSAERLPASVNKVVEESLKLVDFEVLCLRATVQRVLADEDPVADMDRIQIEQVLVNLLWNACEAVRENAAESRFLTVRTTLAGDVVEVSVADNGPGVPADDAEKIFEPFISTKPDGLGMGLPISRMIVESHGGKIWATANPSQGATFHFTIPLARSELTQDNNEIREDASHV